MKTKGLGHSSSDCLPSILQALGSIPRTMNLKKEKKKTGTSDF
jgi:hypothetical protein